MVNVFKTISDILLYLTFVSLLPAFENSWLLFISLLALGALAAFINDKSDSIIVKIISAVLPTASLAFMQEGQLFFLVLILGYLFIVMITGHNDIDYQQYRYFFGLPAVAVTAAVFVFITSSLENRIPMLFGSLYLLIGTIVLRRKRMGTNVDNKASLYNSFEVITIVLSVTVVCMILYAGLSHSQKIFEIVTLPIAMVIRGLITVLVFLGRMLVKAVKPDEPVDINPQTTDEIYDEIFNPDEIIDNVDGTNVNFVIILERIILIILAIAIIALVLYFLYTLVKNLNKNADDEEYTEANGVESVQRTKHKRERVDASNRQQVRKIYRDFLFSANRKGVPVDKQTTSEDILNNELYAGNPDARILREIYIKARYQTDSLVSDEDVIKAKNAQERLAEL